MVMQGLAQSRLVHVDQEGTVVVRTRSAQLGCGARNLIFSIIHNVFSGVDFRLNIPLSFQSSRDDLQIVSSVISLPGGEKGHIEIPRIMIHSTSTTVTSCYLNTFIIQDTEVSFLPGILMTSNHHTRVVPPQKHHMMVGEIKVLIQPVLQGEVGEDIARLGDEYGFLDLGFIVVYGSAGFGRVEATGGYSTARQKLRYSKLKSDVGEFEYSGFD